MVDGPDAGFVPKNASGVFPLRMPLKFAAASKAEKLAGGAGGGTTGLGGGGGELGGGGEGL